MVYIHFGIDDQAGEAKVFPGQNRQNGPSPKLFSEAKKCPPPFGKSVLKDMEHGPKTRAPGITRKDGDRLEVGSGGIGAGAGATGFTDPMGVTTTASLVDIVAIGPAIGNRCDQVSVAVDIHIGRGCTRPG